MRSTRRKGSIQLLILDLIETIDEPITASELIVDAMLRWPDLKPVSVKVALKELRRKQWVQWTKIVDETSPALIYEYTIPQEVDWAAVSGGVNKWQRRAS